MAIKIITISSEVNYVVIQIKLNITICETVINTINGWGIL